MRNFRNIAVSGQLLKWMVLLLVYHSFTSANAQQHVTFDPLYYNITTEHGLPSLETYSVKQDSKGYIWICTDAGVCRYDGFNFKTFTVADGLTDNVVFDTYEDYKGRIWFVTYNSLLCYYENGKIKKYKYNHKIAQFVKEQVTSKALIIDSNDNVYYSLRLIGMYKIDKSGNYQQLHKGNYTYYTKQIEGNGMISVLINERKWSKDYVPLIPFNGRIPKNNRKAIYTPSNVIFPENKYNLKNNYVLYDSQIYDIKGNTVVYIGESLIDFKIVDSVFWISSLKGIIKAELLPNGMLEEKERYFKDVQFSNFTVIGNYYFMTTLDRGVYICQDFNAVKAGELDGLLQGSILSVTKLNKEVLVSNSGLVQNIASNFITDFGIPQRSSKKIYSSDKSVFISSSYSSSTINHYSSKLNAQLFFLGYTGDFKVVGDKIYFVSMDVNEYDIKKNSFFQHYVAWDDKIRSQRFIKAIEILPDGKIIVGSVNGVFEVKDKMLYPMDFGIPNLKVVSLNYNKHWGLIIGTSDNGVFAIKNGKVSHVNVSKGLLADKVNTIKVYDDLIFIGTVNGLNVLTLKNNQVQNVCYSKNYFYESIDINDILVDDDLIFLATNTGLIKLKKTVLFNQSKGKKANVFLEEVLVEGNHQKVVKNIVFPYDAQLLKLEFSVLQFDNWFSKNYQYRLGKTGQWIDLESPSISLFRPSGEFDVEIRYMNADFQWSSPVKLCHVDVLVPFWMKWYFWVAIASIILFLLFRIYQRRQLRIQEKLIQETQMLSLEQQMQNARMNPHFIFNVFNSIHSFMLQQNIEEAEKYLERFSKLLREILSNSSEGTISLLAEKSILNKYLELEQLRFKHSFEYEVNVPFELQELKIPSMLIQPFVENAVLYSDKSSLSKKSMIKVDVSLKNERCIEVIVLNSGLISAENLAKIERSSIKNAVGITKKRLDNYNKLYEINDFSLSVKIIDNEFTVIRLNIPIIDEK